MFIAVAVSLKNFNCKNLSRPSPRHINLSSPICLQYRQHPFQNRNAIMLIITDLQKGKLMSSRPSKKRQTPKSTITIPKIIATPKLLIMKRTSTDNRIRHQLLFPIKYAQNKSYMNVALKKNAFLHCCFTFQYIRYVIIEPKHDDNSTSLEEFFHKKLYC